MWSWQLSVYENIHRIRKSYFITYVIHVLASEVSLFYMQLKVDGHVVYSGSGDKTVMEHNLLVSVLNSP